MPESQQESGSKYMLPVGIRRDYLVHQREEAFGVVLRLDIDVEFDMKVLWLGRIRAEATKMENICTLISSSIVSAKVGMACWGCFMVRACCIPSSPNQARSLMCPVTIGYQR